MGAPRTKRRATSGRAGHAGPLAGALGGLSRKSIRLLEDEGVIERLVERPGLVVTGPAAHVGATGDFARLAFWIDGDDRLNVGLARAVGPEGPWTPSDEDCEPFTLRSYGYFRRYVQRLRRAS